MAKMMIIDVPDLLFHLCFKEDNENLCFILPPCSEHDRRQRERMALPVRSALAR
jgi:hypothetical protein